jgi:hypothetical protein
VSYDTSRFFSALEWEVFCVLSLNVQVVWWGTVGEAKGVNEDFAV